LRILLINPESSKASSFYWKDFYLCEPLALGYLSAGAKAQEHEVTALDMRFHSDALESNLLDFKPDLIGVTGYTMSYFEILNHCRQSKALIPGVHTVIGGHHATIRPMDFFFPEVDYVVCGEGVTPFTQLLTYLESGELNPQIPDVWCRQNNVFKSGGHREIYDIDKLPFPDRSCYAQDAHRFAIGYMKPIALLRTTEGCRFRCSFCSLWKIMQGKYLIRDIDKVVEELSGIEQYYIHIIDDEPWLEIKRMFALAEAIRAAGIDKRYMTYCRIDTITKQQELLAAWRRVGLDCLLIGIEAVSPIELKKYNKGIKTDQIEVALHIAKELDIRIYLNFIIDPAYTAEDFDRVEQFIVAHDIRYPGFTVLTPLPGTKGLENFDAITERMPNGMPNWALFDLQNPVTETRLPKEEFMQRVTDLQQRWIYG